MPNDVELAGQWQEVEDEDTQLDTSASTEIAIVAEPEVDLTLSREELEAEAASEGETNVVLAELEDRDELTLADLKRLPEAKGVSDDELIEMAVAAGLKVAGTEIVAAEKVAPVTRNWKVYGKDGKEVTNFAKMSAADLIAATIGYRAINSDQKRTFDEVVRLAQLGHHNEQRMAQVMSDRNMLAERVQLAGTELAKADQERQAWQTILADQTGSSFLKAQERYFEALRVAPQVNGPSQAEVQATGIVFYQNTIFPALQAVASAYPGSNLTEIDKMAQYLLAQEPLAAMDKNAAWERIKYIVNSQIPAMLEEAGFRVAGAPEPVQPNIVPSINTRPGAVGSVPAGATKSVAEQKRLLAENANLKRALAKKRNMPGIGPRGHGGDLISEEQSGNLEKRLEGMSSSDAKAFLRSLK